MGKVEATEAKAEQAAAQLVALALLPAAARTAAAARASHCCSNCRLPAAAAAAAADAAMVQELCPKFFNDMTPSQSSVIVTSTPICNHYERTWS
eukprot:COSAG05_NODE_4509_length_1483_cov_12.553468_1_plen_94_part_00